MQKTDFDIEILIHDDASTDGTQQIILEYQEMYPDIIKPFFQKENTYSKGVKRIGYLYNYPRAKGKYIAECEGDDYWNDPYKLQKQVDYMEAHPECGFSCHGTLKVNDNEQKVSEVCPYTYSRNVDCGDFIRGGGGVIGTNSVMYRKSAMENPPQFFFDAPVGDYPMQIYLSSQGHGYYMNEIMSCYRFNATGSWSSKMYQGKEQFAKQIELNNKLVNMLKSVDEFTNREYESIIKAKIIELNFNRNILERNIDEFKNGDSKELYYSLPLHRRCKIIFQCSYPLLYQNLWLFKKEVLRLLTNPK
jgi:glycosyltransferase involved in cell wall biosynthesis